MSKIIIDVREPDEYSAGHYRGAINIPLSVISTSDQITKLDKDQEIIVYCRSGGRSQSAEQILCAKGFTNVINGINQQSLEMAENS